MNAHWPPLVGEIGDTRCRDRGVRHQVPDHLLREPLESDSLRSMARRAPPDACAREGAFVLSGVLHRGALSGSVPGRGVRCVRPGEVEAMCNRNAPAARSRPPASALWACPLARLTDRRSLCCSVRLRLALSPDGESELLRMPRASTRPLLTGRGIALPRLRRQGHRRSPTAVGCPGHLLGRFSLGVGSRRANGRKHTCSQCGGPHRASESPRRPQQRPRQRPYPVTSPRAGVESAALPTHVGQTIRVGSRPLGRVIHCCVPEGEAKAASRHQPPGRC